MIRFVHQGDLRSPDKRDIAFDSELGAQKSRLGQDPAHSGSLRHQFGASVANGTHTLFTIPHKYDYVPSAMVQGSSRFIDIFNTTGQLRTYLLPYERFGLTDGQIFYFRVDEINLTIYYLQIDTTTTFMAGSSWDFVYEIYAEPGLAS